MPDEIGGNPVDVDPSRIDAEFEALAGEAGAPAGADAPPAGEPADWRVAAAGMVAVFAKLVAPAWEVTDQEQAAVAEPLAVVLGQFFPAVQVDPRYQAVGALVMAAGAVALARYDADAGRFRPLRRPGAARATGGGGVDGLNLSRADG